MRVANGGEVEKVMNLKKPMGEDARTSLADMIGAGARPGDTFVLVGFDNTKHVHTYDGRPIERPAGWVDGTEVIFVGWSGGTYVRRAQFTVNGEPWAGKGLASCLLVEEVAS